jgi:hypothetical protein
MNFLSVPEEVIWEMSLDDGRDPEPAYRAAKSKTCQRCGARGLVWREVAGRWRLAYGAGKLAGRLHACESEVPR